MKIQKITEKIDLNVEAQWPWDNPDPACLEDCKTWKSANAYYHKQLGELSECYEESSSSWSTWW